MKQIYTLLVCLFLIYNPLKAQLSVNGYKNYNLSGFNVLVQNTAFTMDSSLTNSAISLLQTKLQEILQFDISQTKIRELKAVPIFMDWNTTTGAAQYHPSQAWLIANGYIPQKAMCVEISNIKNFINWTNQNQPYMVLHELAHAYHHRVLNFNSTTITNAFNNAVSNNLYQNVSYHIGGGNYSIRPKAYALSNDIEYFAEITEAYFGLNDYFPFNYNDLRNYDVVGFNVAKSIWGDIALSLQFPQINTIIAYPNPVSTYIYINRANLYMSYAIYNLVGTEIIKGKIASNNEKINLETFLSGIYFLKFENGTTIKFIKE